MTLRTALQTLALLLVLASAAQAGFAGLGDAVVITDAHRAYIDGWLARHGLNPWGDPPDTMYPGGSPLADETAGTVQDRHVYLVMRFDELWAYVTGSRSFQALSFGDEAAAALDSGDGERIRELVADLVASGPASVAAEAPILTDLARRLRHAILYGGHGSSLTEALEDVEAALGR